MLQVEEAASVVAAPQMPVSAGTEPSAMAACS
jgi:hypothetical protein